MMTRSRTSIVAGLLMTAMLAGACGDRSGADAGMSQGSEDGGIELREYPLGGDFTLTSHDGQPFKLSDARGKIVFLFFGFVSCPDVCPLTMSKLDDAVSKVEGAREQVRVLFVTVDVDRDTPDVLARYVSSFRVPMTGLTGTRAQIDAVVEQYKSAYEITPSTSAAGPQVSHTSYTYLIDRAGNVRGLVSHDDTADQIATALAQLLKS
jgi:protein SCO1/2